MNSNKFAVKSLSKILFLAVCVLSVSFISASAQDKKDTNQNTIKVSSEEKKAVDKIEKAKTLAEKVVATKEFIQKYPQSPARNQAALYLSGQISQTKNNSEITQNGETYLTIFTEPAEADYILPTMIYSYSDMQKYKEAFDAGEKYLARHPEDASIRLKLAIDGSNLARAGTKDYVPASHNYAMQAIELAEADKKPSDFDDARWSEFKTKWLPQLYLSSGILNFSRGDTAKARANFEKATQLDSKEINSWIMLATIADDEYQQAAKKYTVASDSDANKPELLKQANERIDKAIDLYARIVALTDDRPEAKNINEQIRQNLKDYYQYRHKNLTGMNELIDKYKK